MESTPESPTPLPPAEPTRLVRILIVEDDPPTGHALELLLKHHQYDVTCASSVADALDALAKGPAPDAVLLDLMLPDGDGTRVLEAVRAGRLPSQVTIVTGVGDPERIDRARRLLPDALLQKPVDFSQILKRLPPPA